MGRAFKWTGKAVLVGGGLFVLWLFAVWPPPVWYRTHWPAETAFQQMRGGRERRYHPVPLDSISKWVPEAVLAGEDQRFHEHGGIDWVNLRRALGYPRDRFAWGVARDRNDLWKALGRAWERRAALRGASTLTQQLAKNLYLSPSRNPLRKVKEAVTSYRLESALGKERILELYLNVAEMGQEVWGVEAASRYYFDRSAGALSLGQAAAIAGMLPFPLRSNPSFRPARMQSRQRLILRFIRGEEVVVPPVPEEEESPIPVESLPPAPADTLVLPPDTMTLPLVPLESLPSMLPEESGTGGQVDG